MSHCDQPDDVYSRATLFLEELGALGVRVVSMRRDSVQYSLPPGVTLERVAEIQHRYFPTDPAEAS